MINFLIRLLISIATAAIFFLLYRKKNLPLWLKKKVKLDKPHKGIAAVLIIGLLINSCILFVRDYYTISDMNYIILQGIMIGFIISLVPDFLVD